MTASTHAKKQEEKSFDAGARLRPALNLSRHDQGRFAIAAFKAARMDGVLWNQVKDEPAGHRVKKTLETGDML